jgi:type I restriction enzyme, S subunit
VSHDPNFRTYVADECVVFRKTDELYGGLSNMAPGYPLVVNGIAFFTAEHLYQCCRFPDAPDVQRRIIAEKSPMTAKMRSKPFRNFTRPDWDSIRVAVMRWCLRVKLAQHWGRFGELLIATGSKPIVEESHKDRFWGAKRNGNGLLEGCNVLGRLLRELREELVGPNNQALGTMPATNIPNFLLLGREVGAIEASRSGSHELQLSRTTANEHRTSVDLQGVLERDSWLDLMHFLSASGISPQEAAIHIHLRFGESQPESKLELLGEMSRRLGIRFHVE